MNQLDRIMEVTGRPSFDDLQATRSPFAETMLESLPPTKLRRAREVNLANLCFSPTVLNDALTFI